ncbi:helix-turn-helix domain-containing protein [Mycolicibacterium neoaurum]|uniref:helix-turn-helix domain-containing protein n=1 Tax=Mycolicibacterium neoaurum TaxID=1795 RepID=UPI001F4D06AC|nr:helix-turn-helix transcriptional regulator [Mycolicibacterium neoaurum]
MNGRPDVLRTVMTDTQTGQSELARLSGVRQPSISQFLTGRTPLSDDQLDRLLSCMGYQLQVIRQPIQPDLTRPERRSWLLHRQIARKLTPITLQAWAPTIAKNLQRLRAGVTGEPHTTNVGRWEELVTDKNLPGLHRVLTGLDRDCIEMREVSPLSGLLSDEERRATLAAVRS